MVEVHNMLMCMKKNLYFLITSKGDNWTFVFYQQSPSCFSLAHLWSNGFIVHFVSTRIASSFWFFNVLCSRSLKFGIIFIWFTVWSPIISQFPTHIFNNFWDKDIVSFFIWPLTFLRSYYCVTLSSALMSVDR